MSSRDDSLSLSLSRDELSINRSVESQITFLSKDLYLIQCYFFRIFSWLEELRNNPISSISPSALTHAVDLSDPTLPLPDSISAFMTHDINQPFPPQGYNSKKLKSQKEQNQIGVHGSYDFVHSRLLVLGIEKDQWVNVIKNMAQVLSEWSSRSTGF